MRIEDEIKQVKFRSPHQKAVINLIFTASWLEGKQQSFFKLHGLTMQQYNILRILKGQQPKVISGTEIKSRMLDKNSDVSRLLDRLSAKGLISKQTCADDKRATDVSITTAGLEILVEMDKKQKLLDTVLHLTEEEAEELSNLLDKGRG
jgi:DNA-binding MarR family transcriptional regulator